MNPVSEAVHERDTIDVFDLLSIVWSRRWFVVCVTALTVALSVLYIFVTRDTYRVDVLLKPTDLKSSLGGYASQGALGGLANLAGINLNSSTSAEPIAVLTSREFTRAFLEEQNLLPVLYAKRWDASKNQWKPSRFLSPPDIRDAIDLFNKKIRTVQEDRKTGFVIMTVQWRDPNLATAWANMLVDRLNERMRSRALEEASANVTYLKQELASSDLVSMQQSVGRVLESEIQRLMLARATKEYSFKVIDHAVPPKRPSWPKPAVIIPIAFLLGASIAIFYVLVRQAIGRDGRATPA
jgi:uncharacterized protein involved in exopolysaccharide biosynthesis